MFDEEKEPFIENSRNEDSRSCLSPKLWNRTLIFSLTANAVLLALCVFLSGALLSLSTSNLTWRDVSRKDLDEISEPYCITRLFQQVCQRANEISAPANNIIEYEYRSLIPNDTRFTGHPGTEWEHSIHDIMAGEVSNTALNVGIQWLTSYRNADSDLGWWIKVVRIRLHTAERWWLRSRAWSRTQSSLRGMSTAPCP